MFSLIGLIVFGVVMLIWPFWYKAELRSKRRKDSRYSPPHLMGVFDELYPPDAHQARQIREIENEIPAPAPLPGDLRPKSRI